MGTSDFALHTAFIGAGATLLIDAWALVRRRVFGIPAPDYGLVGRWIGHMPRGRFRHDRIAAAPAVRSERTLGWIAHYAIGISFAAALLFAWGAEWAQKPTLAPAVIVGAATVLAPFVLMQPGMGAGFFASRTPRPWAARFQSFVTHLFFGLGLYLAAILFNYLPS